MNGSTKIRLDDDIDIILTLNPHGWSTCFLFVVNQLVEIRITHILGNPYQYLIEALVDLINGGSNAVCLWYDEPGGHKIELNRMMTDQHKVIVSVIEFEGWNQTDFNNQTVRIEFQIKVKQLITVLYLQLQKIQLLLRDRQFAGNRAKDFPFQEFQNFEKLVKPYLILL